MMQLILCKCASLLTPQWGPGAASPRVAQFNKLLGPVYLVLLSAKAPFSCQGSSLATSQSTWVGTRRF